MLAHFSLPTPSEPTYKEREEELRYSCVCCGSRFNEGRRYAKDSELEFCEGCVKEGSHDAHMINLGLTLCQIFNVTMNECEILK